MNLKLLRSLPSEWKTHALIWRNKVEIETISLDDLYNNLKIYEPEITGSSRTSQNLQNVSFVSNSTNNTNITNTIDDTAHGVSTTHTKGNGVNSICLDNLCDAVICAFLRSQPNSTQLSQEDLEQLEEMDLQWEMAMLKIRARRFVKRTGKKLDINGQRVGFNKSKVEFFNCHKHGNFARKCRFPRNQENKGRENNTRTIAVETPTQNALIAQDGIGGYDLSYQDEVVQPTNHALMAFTSSGSSSSSDSEYLIKAANWPASPAVESFVNLTDKSRSDKGYHSVPPPLTENFIPRKPYLTFMDEIVESENLDVTIVVTPSNNKMVKNKDVFNTVESDAVRMNNTSAPIIEDWNSDDESEIDYTVRPSTEKIKSVKTVRETDAPKQNPRGNQRNWNNLMSQRLGSDFKMTNKACYDCGSFEHLHYVCDKKVERTVWNNSRRVNHKNFTNKMTHPHPKRSFVPQAVLTKSGKLSTAGAAVNTVRPVNTANTKAVNTVRSVNTAASKPIVNHPRTKTNAFKRGYSQSSRPFKRHFANKNSIINTNVNTARVKHTTARDRAVVSENKGKGANAVKASACWGNPQQKEYKEKGVIDSGCSRHMTGNKCYLDEYEDYDGGFVSLSKRKNRTLIEAARTMLVDSKLPTTFWAEVVNTACYVLNIVLVIKPHNKTPYELIHGRPPLIDFMKPFGCPVTILNTKDHIGNKTNGIAGTKDNIVAGQAQKEKEPEQEYILIPLCTTDPIISQGSKDCKGDAGMKLSESRKITLLHIKNKKSRKKMRRNYRERESREGK
ncbi:ribonuclease H-like domain-containing protein [Tanacetum coccineum]